MDELIGRALFGVIGINLDNRTVGMLEAEAALAKPVNADRRLGYDQFFEWVQKKPF